MAGKRIAVVPGSTNMQAIQDQLKRRKLDATLVEIGDREAGYTILARGDVDGFATDKLVLLALMQRAPREFLLLPEDLSFEPFAMSCRWETGLSASPSTLVWQKSSVAAPYDTTPRRKNSGIDRI